MSVLGPPTGFEIALPEPWKVARTAPRVNQRVGIDPAKVGLAMSFRPLAEIDHGGPYPQLVAELPDSGAQFELSIYAIDVPATVPSIRAALAQRGPSATVDLAGGEAVHFSSCADERIHHRYYLPVPDTEGEVAFLSFTGPEAEADDLRLRFDEVASGVTFTWAPSAEGAQPGPPGALLAIPLLIFALAVIFNDSLSIRRKTPVLMTGTMGSFGAALVLMRRNVWLGITAAWAALALVYWAAVGSAS